MNVNAVYVMQFIHLLYIFFIIHLYAALKDFIWNLNCFFRIKIYSAISGKTYEEVPLDLAESGPLACGPAEAGVLALVAILLFVLET